jgi:hypothetical protein
LLHFAHLAGNEKLVSKPFWWGVLHFQALRLLADLLFFNRNCLFGDDINHFIKVAVFINNVIFVPDQWFSDLRPAIIDATALTMLESEELLLNNVFFIF